MLASIQARARRSLFAVLLAAGGLPAAQAADDQNPAGSIPVISLVEQRSQLASDIEHQENRRALGITSTAVGGIAAVVGLAVAINDAQQRADAEAQNTGRNSSKTYVNVIGLAVGIPLIALGTYLIVDSSKQLHRLHRQNLKVSYSPENDGVTVGMAFNF